MPSPIATNNDQLQWMVISLMAIHVLVCLVIITRNSSGDEIANVNFLYDDIVHVLQNTIDSCINSATDRRDYVLERMCLPNSVK